MSESFIELLIVAVRKTNLLWDMTDRRYHNRLFVDREWTRIAKELGETSKLKKFTIFYYLFKGSHKPTRWRLRWRLRSRSVAFKPKRFVRWIAVAFVFFFSVDINMASCECESEEFLVLTVLLEDAENIR
jgi:hypothetical protein